MKRLNLVLEVLTVAPRVLISTSLSCLKIVPPMIFFVTGIIWMYHRDFKISISFWEAIKTGVWLGPCVLIGIQLLLFVVIVSYILIKGDYPPFLRNKSKSPE